MMAAAAWLYAGLALIVVLFQFALALGVPWGHLAMGGRYPGRFPPLLRVGALVQAGLLVFFSLVVLGRAGALGPLPLAWAFWVALAFAVLSAILNLITPSIPERRLWGPVALLMLVCVLWVALG